MRKSIGLQPMTSTERSSRRRMLHKKHPWKDKAVFNKVFFEEARKHLTVKKFEEIISNSLTTLDIPENEKQDIIKKVKDG